MLYPLPPPNTAQNATTRHSFMSQRGCSKVYYQLSVSKENLKYCARQLKVDK